MSEGALLLDYNGAFVPLRGMGSPASPVAGPGDESHDA